jgi:hypothetical protein
MWRKCLLLPVLLVAIGGWLALGPRIDEGTVSDLEASKLSGGCFGWYWVFWCPNSANCPTGSGFIDSNTCIPGSVDGNSARPCNGLAACGTVYTTATDCNY